MPFPLLQFSGVLSPLVVQCFSNRCTTNSSDRQLGACRDRFADCRECDNGFSLDRIRQMFGGLHNQHIRRNVLLFLSNASRRDEQQQNQRTHRADKYCQKREQRDRFFVSTLRHVLLLPPLSNSGQRKPPSTRVWQNSRRVHASDRCSGKPQITGHTNADVRHAAAL